MLSEINSSPTEPISAAVGFYSSDQTTQYYIFNVPPEFIFLHPEYDCGNFNNDLSIIYLPGWVPYTGKFILMYQIIKIRL